MQQGVIHNGRSYISLYAQTFPRAFVALGIWWKDPALPFTVSKVVSLSRWMRLILSGVCHMTIGNRGFFTVSCNILPQIQLPGTGAQEFGGWVHCGSGNWLEFPTQCKPSHKYLIWATLLVKSTNSRRDGR